MKQTLLRNDVNYGSIVEIQHERNGEVADLFPPMEPAIAESPKFDHGISSYGFLAGRNSEDARRRPYTGSRQMILFVMTLASVLAFVAFFESDLWPLPQSTSVIPAPAATAAASTSSSRAEAADTLLSTSGRSDAFDWPSWGHEVKVFWQSKFAQWKESLSGFWNDHKDDRPTFNTTETVDQLHNVTKDFWNSAVTTFDEALNATKAQLEKEKEEMQH